MKNHFLSLLFFAVIISFSCKRVDPLAPKPYRFSENWLDSLVDNKEALMNVVSSYQGKVQEKKYFLSDTVCYDIEYNKFGEIISVHKFNGKGIELWQDNYYPNGQRMAHFEKSSDPLNGVSFYNGFYEAYFEFGEIKERGMYKNNEILWMVPYTKDRVSGDTILYELVQ